MKTKTTLIVAGGLALAALPPALAGDAGSRFKEMDADRDDRVTRAEYAGAALAHFARLDTNGDGVVSPEEVTAGQDKRTSRLKFWEKDDKTSAPEMVSAFDQNTDGQITRAEHETGANTRFATLDTDKDGALTEKELEAGQAPALAPPGR